MRLVGPTGSVGLIGNRNATRIIDRRRRCSATQCADPSTVSADEPGLSSRSVGDNGQHIVRMTMLVARPGASCLPRSLKVPWHGIGTGVAGASERRLHAAVAQATAADDRRVRLLRATSASRSAYRSIAATNTAPTDPVSSTAITFARVVVFRHWLCPVVATDRVLVFNPVLTSRRRCAAPKGGHPLWHPPPGLSPPLPSCCPRLCCKG